MLNLSRSTLAHAGALLALIAAAVGLSACGSDDNSTLQKKTLTFTQRDTDFFSYVDNAPKTTLTADGPEQVSNGDQLTFSNDLLDGSNKDVGDVDVSCIFTRTSGRPRRGLSSGPEEGSSTICTGVLTVPGGSLTANVGGKAITPEGTSGAIVGGTGDYAGATGAFTSKGDPEAYTIDVFVPEG